MTPSHTGIHDEKMQRIFARIDKSKRHDWDHAWRALRGYVYDVTRDEQAMPEEKQRAAEHGQFLGVDDTTNHTMEQR